MARKTAKNVGNRAATHGVKCEAKLKEENELLAPTTATIGWVLRLFVVVAVVVASYFLRKYYDASTTHYIARTDVTKHLRLNVTCAPPEQSTPIVPGCHPENKTMCGRAVIDNYLSPDKVLQMRDIAETGMQNRSRLGGPTIMDINTGFVRDSDGLVNIYQPEKRIPNTDKPGVKRFSQKQFSLYRRHPHVDKENTNYYDYSGLLYLSDYNEEFTGGLFSFIDDTFETIIEPARGRLVIFTAGSENLHVVRKVETGTRYALSLWFSCDERKEFQNFLDGTMHKHFRRP
ncbi:hypothetical protein CCR75_008325 [Bremia lactucae]|uniref:Fe2OG dioxygenase domain-containing protein n=1 Tax=Bremia lactucae TaxID=4779 RepID=A0A976FJE0_BRELC|nr:hypothetical protein CCR75_008325 [Bremia lactucae]